MLKLSPMLNFYKYYFMSHNNPVLELNIDIPTQQMRKLSQRLAHFSISPGVDGQGSEFISCNFKACDHNYHMILVLTFC